MERGPSCSDRFWQRKSADPCISFQNHVAESCYDDVFGEKPERNDRSYVNITNTAISSLIFWFGTVLLCFVEKKKRGTY